MINDFAEDKARIEAIEATIQRTPVYCATTASIPTASTTATPYYVGQLIIDAQAADVYVITAIAAEGGTITKVKVGEPNA